MTDASETTQRVNSATKTITKTIFIYEETRELNYRIEGERENNERHIHQCFEFLNFEACVVCCDFLH